MTTARMLYLDHLRAFAMLFGVLLHTTTLGDFGWLEVFRPLSDNFRMGTFFAVSGFFAGMLLTRRGAPGFLRHRSLAVGLPFLSALILLNPLTLWLVHNIHNDPLPLAGLPGILRATLVEGNGLQGAMVWHLHLWFLVSLLAYTLAAPLLLRAIDALRLWPAGRRAAGALPAPLQALAVALAVAAAVLAMRALFTLALKPFDAPWILRATLSYAPWYALGLLLWRERALWDRLHRPDPLLIAFAAGLWLLSGLGLTGGLPGAFYIFRREITVCAAFLALLWLFRATLDRDHPLARRITGSVYTVYLFHYLAIYLIGTALMPVLAPGSAALFWAVALGAFGATFLLHVLVIDRVALLRLMFNGKRSEAARPAPRSPAARPAAE